MGQPLKPGDAYPVPSSMWLPPDKDLVPNPGGRPRQHPRTTDSDDPFSVKIMTLDTKYPPRPSECEKKSHIGESAPAPKQAQAETGPPVLTPALERLLDDRKPYQMTDDEVAVAKFLVSKGYKQSEVCRILDRGRQAVSRAVRSENARECLSRHQRKLAMDWVRASAESAKKGRHEAAQAALEAIGAVDVPEAAGKAGGVQVNVGVALPGAGAPVGVV